MEQQIAFEETCERYLLGELSEAERAQFEEAYFANDALFERFLAVKDELIDAYARDELAEAKRTRFTQHFLTTAPRRRQLDEAQEFIRAVTAVSTKASDANAPIALTTPKSSWQSLADFFKLRPFAWQFALASLLLITLGGTWVFVRNWEQQATRSEQAAQQTTPDEQVIQQPAPVPTTAPPTNENNNTAPSPAPANINQSPANTNVAPKPTPKKPTARPPQISPAQIASIILLPVTSRDINDSNTRPPMPDRNAVGFKFANTLRLDSDTRVVRVRLVFKSDDYRNYSATITTIEGASVWQRKTLKADTGGANKSVTLQLAPALLSQQDYIVTLKGQTAAGQTETIGEYYFRVERDSSSQNTPTPERQP